MILLQWALIILQPILAESAALVTGLILSIYLAGSFVRFIRSALE